MLVEYIRDHLRLTGTHVGCDTSQCGACVVHVDGKAMKSCTMLAASAEGAAVTTVEGLAKSKDDRIRCRWPSKKTMVCNAGFAPRA